MITPLKNLTVVEDGKDKIIKEMKLDSRYTIPKGVNDKSNSNNINELIDKIHTVNFIERHTKLYHKYTILVVTCLARRFDRNRLTYHMTLDVDVEK